MRLMLKDEALMDIQDNGSCIVLDFDRLPFSLRKERLPFADFIEWCLNRALSIRRRHRK